ncbi:hypothetical protein BO94DRAFT_26255 [Aspergillus sclerotioniger CBS 115572]|uniref:Uncharacterized protein n=1 Tax=Aspergillus sclerotioniger CBS 115572 TaxID=1450535 RepID=A0A317X0H8_9EURO|nr:hypothetical protein BO94DRAFT_26255 [Aspergillus sclerotioniger CBS 115572]PWY90478.1 hypothetical protein BO94DRAFT_26255 [Aspergillus sclerotioniger CBS 115572]
MVVLKNTKSLVLRYSPVNKPSHVAMRYLSAEVHPLRPKIAHMYATRDKDTLWWMVNPSYLMSSKMKRLVRSWCSRRARTAFRQALKEHGFDTDGRRIRDEPLDSRDRGKDLKGNVELLLHAEIMRMRFEDIRKEMSAGVGALVDRMEKKNAPLKSGKKQKKTEADADD